MAKQISTKPISKKRKFVKDGIFYAELNDFLARELAENGYAGCEIRVTPKRTEVTIRATQVLQVVGENGRRIRELTALVQKRFRFPKKGIFMYAEKIPNKGLSALAQAQAVKFRLLQGLSVRRAAYSVVQFIMNKGAKGCEVIVSGKLRGQRAKGMKFKDGYMIHAGDAVNYYIDTAVKHVHLRQGVIGIKVKIMLPHDPNGIQGVKKDLPDSIKIHDIIDKDDDEDDEDVGQIGDGSGGIMDDGMGGGNAPASGGDDDNNNNNVNTGNAGQFNDNDGNQNNDINVGPEDMGSNVPQDAQGQMGGQGFGGDMGNVGGGGGFGGQQQQFGMQGGGFN